MIESKTHQAAAKRGEPPTLAASNLSASVITVQQEKSLILLIIILVGIFFLATIRAGQDWGDDFGLYIYHARNIAEGQPYASTRYIYNPLKGIGPLTYPPVFPLMLAPVIKFWGLNLIMMKVEIVLIFVLSLIAIFAAFRAELPPPYLAALIAFVGFNPQFWQFKDNIVSDLPFLLFTYLSLYLIHKAAQEAQTRTSQIVYLLLISLSIYLAYGTRTIGIVLVPCLIIYYALKNKRLRQFGFVTFIVTAVLLYWQTRSANIWSAYASHLGINFSQAALVNSKDLIQDLSEYWINGYSRAGRFALFAVITSLSLVGYLTRIRKKQITCFELFVPFYLGPLLLLPIEIVARFLMPIIPLYIFYALTGLRGIASLFSGRQQRIEKFAFIALLIAVPGSYAGHYSRLDYGPIQDSVTKGEAQQLFAYVQREVGEHEVVIFRKPRALSLFTRRASATWHNTITDGELWDFFHQVNASYLIVGPAYIEPEDQWFIREFVNRNKTHLPEIFANADFKVYRLPKEHNLKVK